MKNGYIGQSLKANSKAIFLLLFLFQLVSISRLSAQLNVDFASSDTSGCGSLFSIFQDLSSSPGNPIVSWEWDFGDGTTHAFTQNPSHIYLTSGCFDVSLKVTTNNGTVDSLTKIAYACVYPNPLILAPDINPPVVCAPANVCLQGNIGTTAAISNFIWEVGAGNIFQGDSVCVTLTDPGAQTITIQVQDVNGCLSDSIFTNIIQVNPSPVADFTSNATSSCQPPLLASFFSSSTYNGGPMPAGSTYTWSFPGAIPSSGNSSTVTNVNYPNSGNFDVTLMVGVLGGCRDTLVQEGFIGVGAVTAGIIVPDTVCAGQPFIIEGTGASTYSWDIDCDNTLDGTNNTLLLSYNNPNTYCIELTASNGTGCSDTEQINIVVNPSPVADFTVDKLKDCETGNPFNFDASASTPVGGVTYIWDFGAGASLSAPYISNVPTATVSYSTVGNKTVTLVVQNADGCTDTLKKTNYINIQIPIANFSASITEGCRPIPITFQSSSTSNDPITNYAWSITPNSGISPLPSTQNIANPVFTFGNSGDFTVQLIITTASGCTDTFERVDYIQIGTLPQMDFTWTPDFACINEPFQFNSTFTNQNWQYAWDFNYAPPAFNTMSSLPDPDYSYTDTGFFDVALIINNNGCRDTLIQQDIVYVNGPKANFDVDPTVFCGLPANFNFTNNSTNGAIGNTNYTWYFNGSATPFSQVSIGAGTTPPNPPSQTYNGAPMTIQIKLIASNLMTGCTDSLKRTVNVGNPIAGFVVADTTVCRNTPVNFIALSSNATTYEWHFGDGSMATTNGNATHTYDLNGTYTDTLIVIDANECRDTMIRQNHILVTGPIVDFSATDSTGCTPFTTSFNNLTVLYPGTTQSSITWVFPNSPPSPVVGVNNPSHTFNANGNYTVGLTVVDSDGCSDTKNKGNFIHATFPDTEFIADDTVTCAGNLITFTPTLPGSTYSWDFGDNTIGNSSGNGTIQHSYDTVGFYSVKVVVTDVNGCKDSLTKVNYIEIENFTPDFTGAPTTAACPPLTTIFQDQSTGNISGWSWNFGDGTPLSPLENPGHIYTFAGNFDVSLIVTHQDGCKDTVVKDDYIVLDGPIGNVTVSPDKICPFDTVTFTVITNRTQTIFYEAQAGNVNFLQTSSTGLDTTYIPFVYTVAGISQPVFQIQDPAGCLYTIPNVPAVTVHRPPVANFTPNPNSGCTPLTVAFTNQSLPGPGAPPVGGNPITAWAWTFGNGNVSSVKNPPAQNYTLPNAYNAQLIVTDNKGCKDTVIKVIQAYLQPDANFYAEDTVKCAPTSIQFNDSTSITIPVAWEWDFGDGSPVSTLEDPVHFYTSDGEYTVSLIITDANGCKDTLVKPQYIDLRHPVASFVVDSTTGCDPFTACFNASSTQSNVLVDTYYWNFGDGTPPQISNIDSICHTFNNPGQFSVYLEVTDILGCKDDTVRNNLMTINTSTIPLAVDVLRTTVLSSNSVRVDYRAYPLQDHRQYILKRFMPGLGWIGIDSTSNINTLSLFDNSPNLDCESYAYCYKVVAQNDCRLYSPLNTSETHCTMSLSTVAQEDAVKLNWTAYNGWQMIDHYEIFRGDAHTYSISAMDSIGAVSATELTFTDTTTFCSDSVFYRIVAIESGGGQQISYSDVSGNAPKHNPPTEKMNIIFASVPDDKVVDISWEPYAGYKPVNYVLERSLGGQVWKELAQLPLGQTTYTDTDVMVDSLSYIYRVYAIDSCGDRSPVGLIGKTILLKASIFMDGYEVPRLDWTKYEKWPSNVEYYEIQVFDELNDWKRVDIVGPNVNTYKDYKTTLYQSTYCYRIIAKEVGGHFATSISNESCVTFLPKLWAPNAFTPNNDGKNDIFLLRGPNIESFEMTIFDRWGKIIFVSRSIDDGWDGTIEGQDAPEGAYVFKVNAVGYKGEPFKLNGSVTLVR